MVATQGSPPPLILEVEGFKSIANRQSIAIAPLTVIAGANSSGKSSMMQTLLLLKQTLESSYDPGVLLLSGPNVRFTRTEQLLSAGRTRFCVGVSLRDTPRYRLLFERKVERGIGLVEMTVPSDKREVTLRPGMTHGELLDSLPRWNVELLKQAPNCRLVVESKRCLLDVRMRYHDKDGPSDGIDVWGLSPASFVEELVLDMMHVPGIRGNPSRTYPAAVASGRFPGTFDSYTAGVVQRWQDGPTKEPMKIVSLNESLQQLGLASDVSAAPVDEANTEIFVALDGAGNGHRLSIADVGFGLSQILPVLVALTEARTGQLVFIEQPEIHLHPRAQVALAAVLARAAGRGVRVVVETHSELLILGIQTQVACKAVPRDLVKLHWFERGDDHLTSVHTAELDANGAFGDWPADFDGVLLDAQRKFLDASCPS